MNGAPLDNDRDNADNDENIDCADECLFDTTKLLYIGTAAVSKYNVILVYRLQSAKLQQCVHAR